MLSLPQYPLLQRDFLLEISRAITAQLDLNEVLRRVLRASVAMTAARAGIIALRSGADRFTVRARAGIPAEHVPMLNDKLHEIVSEIGSGFSQEFLDAKLREMAQAIDPTLAQAVAMPLISGDKAPGLLVIFRSYAAAITANDLQLLQSFADQAAIAVHNAQLYERVNLERQRAQAILHNAADGIMLLDGQLIIQQVNRAFEQMTAWVAADAVGQPLEEVLVWDKLDQQDIRAVLESGQLSVQGVSHAVEGELVRRDGLLQSVGITYAPLFNGEGQLSALIATMRDISSFRKAQEMQSVFISTVSHELRTPVAIIKGYASTLSREDVHWDEATLRHSLSVIEEEADRLTALIEDLLTASKIQAERRVALQLADVRLDSLAESAVERFATQTNRHKFALSFPEHFPSIQGDQRLLRQVVDNLITNAIKYSPNGGTITVGGRFSEKSVTFFVRDEGIGIPEHEQARIFERFYRVSNQTTSKTKGTGLGLYLVKMIVEAHRGTIHVKSQPQQGATFYFTLPRD
ncbi:MAG: ATP-binding protein [Anaerolineae bacterium]|nr:ATP-binding protein [Anaerolineae bacterium]MDW8171459.1 ATP-binding protein [Anaerolineae bacterium]